MVLPARAGAAGAEAASKGAVEALRLAQRLRGTRTQQGSGLTFEFTLDSRLDQVAAALRDQALRAGLSAAANVVEGAAKLNVRAQDLIDTGNLLNSIQATEPEVSGGSGEVLITVGAEYGRIQEWGGTIVPREAKALAVPLTEGARKVGSPRGYPGKLEVRWRPASSKGVLVDEQGVAQYALVRQVTIPARPYMRPAVDSHQAEIANAFAAGMRQVVEAAAAK